MKRPGDKTPDPPGGRAAERLRMFEEARSAHDNDAGDDLVKKRPAPKDTSRVASKGRRRHEKQNRPPK